MAKIKLSIKDFSLLLVLSILFLLILISPTQLLAQSEAVLPDLSSGVSIYKSEKTILDNGLTILLKRVPSSDIISIVALIKSGSAKEKEFLGSGMAHLAEHMLFKDEPEEPKSEIAKQISSLGGSISGSTSYDSTNYQITLPKKNAIKALEIFRKFLMDAQFKQEDLDKEKEVVSKEINLAKDNPSRILWDLLMETVFTRHPYRYPILGYETLLKRINLDELTKYYRKTYNPQNIILSIAGDFQSQEIRQKIEELFAKDKRQSPDPDCEIRELPQVSKREIKRTIKATKFGHGALAFPSVSAHQEDMYPLDLLSIILGSGESSRLNQRLKEKLKIVYSIQAFNYTPKEPGLLAITFRSEPERLEESFEEILSEIENIKDKGVGLEELKKAKQSIKSDILFSQTSCRNLAYSTATNEATLQEPEFDELYLARIEKITPSDIQQVANKYLKPSHLNLISLIPDSEGKQVSQIKDETKFLKRQIEKFTLDGDLRILLLEDKRLPIVNIRAAFAGGLLRENEENNGISNLTSKLLLKGTKGKSAYEIWDLVESWGGHIETFSGNNSFGISLQILKEDLEAGLELLSEIISIPSFSPNEIDKEKNLILAEKIAQKEDIFTIGSLILRKELYQNHPYSMNKLGRIDTIKSFSRKEIIDFYAQRLTKPNMIISVFGDIDNQETLMLIKKSFAKIGSKTALAISDKKIPTLNKEITQFEILEKEQSLFMLGFPACGLINPDRYVLQIISEVLSGLDGRLFGNLRKDLGIAYTLGAYDVQLLGGGHFVFYVATTQENLKKTREKIWEEIEILKKESITDEELERAKRSLIGKRGISLETNDALSWQATLDELYGLGFDNYKDYQKQIEAITVADVRDILKKYFSHNFVEVFISPSSFLLENSQR